MKNPLRIALLAGAVVFAWWAWTVLFPTPQTVIRKRLVQLAKLSSFQPREGNITRLANVAKLANFFADRVEIKVDVPGVNLPPIGSRDELKAVALAARNSGRSVDAKFLDIQVKVNPDKLSALANLTLEAKISGEVDTFIEELQFNLEKVDGEWLINRVQAVKTLR